MIQFLLGVAVGTGLALFNFIFVICHWSKEDDEAVRDIKKEEFKHGD